MSFAVAGWNNCGFPPLDHRQYRETRTDAEARTETQDVQARRGPGVRAPELPHVEASLPPGTARAGSPAPDRVPHAVAREAEASSHVRRGRAAVPPVLPRGPPAKGSNR